MINPEDQIPPDDTFDDEDLEIDEDADPADLEQAYDAAEPAYTLNLDDDDTDDDE